MVGDGHHAGPRGGRDGHAVLGDPARRHAGGGGWQGQDRASDRGGLDLSLAASGPAASMRAGSWPRRSCWPSPGARRMWSGGDCDIRRRPRVTADGPRLRKAGLPNGRGSEVLSPSCRRLGDLAVRRVPDRRPRRARAGGRPGASLSCAGASSCTRAALEAALLGVDSDLLARVGASMPRSPGRCRSAFGGGSIRLGLATTGVAGPDPQEGHAPGTAYIAVARQGAETVVRRLDLPVVRPVREAAVTAVLGLLTDSLKGRASSTPA